MQRLMTIAMEKEIRISVRELVEHAYSSGDLDSRFVGMGKALLGARLHQKLQGHRKSEAVEGEAYHKEVAVARRVEYGSLCFVITGRIDGIWESDSVTTLEEIKTTSTPLEYIDEAAYPVHWAQAQCYAYMYSVEYDRRVDYIQLTYCNSESEELKAFRRPVVFEDLERHFNRMLEDYCDWSYNMYEWSVLRNHTIDGLQFPYEQYRKNQRKLAVAVYRTIAEGRRLFIQAPTGTGKTISVLFPAVKALGEDKAERIFYLTAKTTTRQVALDAVRRMQEKGLRLKTVVLTAKEKICFKEEAVCNPEYCEYARGYYDRINAVIKELFEKEDIVTRETVESYAGSNRLCPFELSLDIAGWADCIICDYNYVFDPRAALKRFFFEREADYVLLVDEAHNLVDRAREMFSSEICKKPFLDIKRSMKTSAPSVAKSAAAINSFFLALKKKNDSKTSCIDFLELKELNTALRDFVGHSEAWLAASHGREGHKELLELYFEALAFLRIYELFDESYTCYIEADGSNVRLKLFCLDPSKLLGQITGRIKSSVFYSATLTPMHYFKDILGGDEKDYNIRLPSPFQTENLCLAIAQDVSTRYRNRDSSLSEVAEYIKSVLDARKGNYFVFFPSYRYMNAVYSIFAERYPLFDVMVQQPAMSEEDKGSFLDRFFRTAGNGLAAFAVMGGVFSEGIDLTGDTLIGAVIVGVGLPQVCFERDIIMNCFNIKNRMGFEYAYMYPGMNKVLQAAGRVIRSDSDRGVVLLIDERFAGSRYVDMFPEEWLHNKTVKSPRELDRLLEKFWSR